MKRAESVAAVAVLRSPWWTVGAALAGIIVGYMLVTGPQAFSADAVSQCDCAGDACAMNAQS